MIDQIVTPDLAKALRQADMLDQGPAHRHLGAADMLRALVAEVQRLNQWADGFTDAHLKERQTGDALVKEQAVRLDDYATEINRLRNVIQSACLGGTVLMLERWEQLFPDAPVPSVKQPEPVATLTISVEGSATTIDCDWGDGVRSMPPGSYPLCLAGR